MSTSQNGSWLKCANYLVEGQNGLGMIWIRRLYATKGSLDDFEPCTHIPLLTILLFDPSEIKHNPHEATRN